MFTLLAQAQTIAQVGDRIEHLAWAETVTAIGTAVLALLGIAVAVALFAMLRALGRTLAALERTVEGLAPKAEPLLEKAAQIADDAATVSRSVREEAERIRQTVEELDQRLRSVADSATERVRHFGAVLKVVQEEVEELLLDATATARGLHAAAEALARPATAGPGEPEGSNGE